MTPRFAYVTLQGELIAVWHAGAHLNPLNAIDVARMALKGVRPIRYGFRFGRCDSKCTTRFKHEGRARSQRRRMLHVTSDVTPHDVTGRPDWYPCNISERVWR